MDNDPIYEKSGVDYRHYKEDEDDGKCGECRFFMETKGLFGNNKCQLVAGRIDKDYTCNLWAEKSEFS